MATRSATVHHLAVDECERARVGRSAAYGWTEALGFDCSQPDFVPEVAKLGRLPDVPKRRPRTRPETASPIGKIGTTEASRTPNTP